MNIVKSFAVAALAAAVLFLSACNDNYGNDASQDPNVNVTLEIRHNVGTNAFVPLQTYTNELGQAYQIEKLKYYISGIELSHTQSGQTYAVPNSYHLISGNGPQGLHTVQLPEVPAGSYNTISFNIGIDPVKNTSLDNTGDLNPSNEMAWNWDTGYKFLLLEGDYFPEGQTETIPLIYHVGTNANYKRVSLPLMNANQAPTAFGSAPKATISMLFDIASVFKQPNVINFDENSTLMNEPGAALIGENYATEAFMIQNVEEFSE